MREPGAEIIRRKKKEIESLHREKLSAVSNERRPIKRGYNVYTYSGDLLSVFRIYIYTVPPRMFRFI